MTETDEKAAVTIQSAFRGYLIRKRNKSIDLVSSLIKNLMLKYIFSNSHH